MLHPQILYYDVTERKEIQTALQLSEQNFRNSMDSSSIGIRISDISDRTDYVNQALLDIFGYRDIDEAKTILPQKYYSPDSHAGWAIRHQKLLRGEPITKRVDIDIIRRDGTVRYLDVSMKEVFWNGQQQFQTLYNDITERKAAEQALKLSEQKYSTLVEGSSDGIIILNDRSVVFANKKMLEMTGYRPAEISGKIFTQLIAPEYKEMLDEGYRIRQASPVILPTYYEMELLTKDGRKIPVETQASRILFEDKYTVMVIIRDIAERKQAQEAVRQSEQNFRNSIDSSFLGITIADINGNTQYLNRAFLDIFGYKNSDELKVKPPHELYTPQSYADYLLRRKQVAEGETLSDNLNIDIIRKDGGIRHLQLFRNRVLWNGQQQYQVFYHDITEQVEAEQALKLSEQNFRNSMDSSFVGIYIVNNDWHTVYVNKALLHIFGYESIEEVHRSPPHEYYTPESLKAYRERSARLAQSLPNPEEYEVDIIRKDGTLRHLQVFRREVFWDGKMRYQALYNDITERVQAEEELKASQENFRNSLDSSLFGVRIVDYDGSTLYLNQTFLDIFGYENREEAAAKSPHEFYTSESYDAYVLRGEKLLKGEPVPGRLRN